MLQAYLFLFISCKKATGKEKKIGSFNASGGGGGGGVKVARVGSCHISTQEAALITSGTRLGRKQPRWVDFDSDFG